MTTVADTPTVPASASRKVPKRQRTEAKLLSATRRVVASKGITGTTIAVVAEEADVAFGTFYNYFPSKEAAVDAVTVQVVEELRQQIDGLLEGVDDAARRIAVGATTTLVHGAGDPEWRSFVTEIGRADNSLYRSLGLRLVDDLEHGRVAGDFDIDDLAATLVLFGGAIGSAMQELAAGNITESSVPHLVTQLLRSIGVPRARAAKVAEATFAELAGTTP